MDSIELKNIFHYFKEEPTDGELKLIAEKVSTQYTVHVGIYFPYASVTYLYLRELNFSS